jgi:hypothetical protein
MNALPSITDWLDQFAACVRNRDLERGRELFDPAVHSFGTRTETAHDLAKLVDRQWSRVWFNTRGFRFLEETVQEIAATDDSLVCVLALWVSEGVNAAGKTFVRRGRCTVLLRRETTSPHGYSDPPV